MRSALECRCRQYGVGYEQAAGFGQPRTLDSRNVASPRRGIADRGDLSIEMLEIGLALGEAIERLIGRMAHHGLEKRLARGVAAHQALGRGVEALARIGDGGGGRHSLASDPTATPSRRLSPS